MAGVLDNLTPLKAPTSPGPSVHLGTSGSLDQTRRFDDPDATRSLIYGNILDEARNLQPITNKIHTLKLSDIDYEDPDTIPLAEHKKAILEGGTLSRRLRGTMSLIDNATGEAIDSQRMTLANIPHLTRHGTFVLNGVEYTLANQSRLRPGIFTRVKDNGEIESHINILPGKGITHRVSMDPETQVFRLNLAQGKIPLMPVLKAMGMTDSQLRQAWGNQIFAANSKSDNPKHVDKLYARLMRDSADPTLASGTKHQQVAEALSKMELDPEITKRTLGQAFTNLSPDAYLATTRKLVAVNRGEQEPDDRDAMAYQTLLGPEDLFAERMRVANRILRPVLWKATLRKSLKHAQPGILTKHVQAALTGSGLGQGLEEVNPADLLDQRTRVTRMGEGGIPSADSVPDESRAVQPSHFGFIDSLRTPESMSVGVDTRFASSTRKGRDGRVYTPFLDVRTGKIEHKSPQDLAESVIAFPGEMNSDKQFVAALDKGKIKFVPKAKVDFALPEMEHSFNHLSNLIPLKSTIKGQRVAMGSRMLTQALPLTAPESPFVRSGIPGDPNSSYEEMYGRHMGAVHSDSDGTVMAVSPHGVTVKGADGKTKTHELYNNFPFNRKTFYHNTPLVQVGQPVKSGDILARSNFTDDKGAAALGLNLRTAYVPYNGLNYEDAYVISRSAAQRLSSEHMYQHDTEWTDDMRHGKKPYMGLFAPRFNRKQIDSMDDDGVIAPGTVVGHGDPLVLMATERQRAHNQISRSKDSSFKDDTLTWEHHAPGVVTDVAKTRKGVVVTVKSVHEMKDGDKLSGRFGDKGVIAKVVDDDQMPHDKEGRPFEVLANPLGVITRANPGQVVEAVLGKIAALTGKPYRVQDFKDIPNMVEYAEQELAKHHLSDTEDIVDPVAGQKIKNILTGHRFFMKLHHTADAKGQGRGTGSYSADETPAKGGETGSKRVSVMSLNALLSHGAHGAIRDFGAIKGQKNQDLLAAFMQGKTPPEPRVPFVHQKFFDTLRASGVHPLRIGGQVQIMAMSNPDVKALAGDREIENAETVDWKDGLKPIKGGLFDPSLTGGHNGNRWSAIKLTEPIVNPVMEGPIRKILGITEKQFEEILAGREELNGYKGPDALAHALDKINLPREIAQARTEVAGSRATARDAAIKRLRILKHAEILNLHPRDWVLDRVPVLPPMFRPVSVMAGSDRPMVADANYLYKELIDANTNLRDMKGQVDDVGDERLAVYRAFKGVTGLGDPIHPKNQERKVKGLLQGIFGSSPKYSMLQRKLLGSTVDMVGRAVITPNPDLDMDQVGIPENRAWEIYKPFIIRNLARNGVNPIDAARMAKDRVPQARKAMVDEMDRRPVILDRAPVLHRYGVMAFWPRLVQGEALQIPPTIVKGFGADFDGDAMSYHVPFSDDAVKDAVEKMLPSKNLLSAGTMKVHQIPQNEYLGGLYTATAKAAHDRPEQVFQTKADAIRALASGRISHDTRVVILNHD